MCFVPGAGDYRAVSQAEHADAHVRACEPSVCALLAAEMKNGKKQTKTQVKPRPPGVYTRPVAPQREKPHLIEAEINKHNVSFHHIPHKALEFIHQWIRMIPVSNCVLQIAHCAFSSYSLIRANIWARPGLKEPSTKYYIHMAASHQYMFILIQAT